MSLSEKLGNRVGDARAGDEDGKPQACHQHACRVENGDRDWRTMLFRNEPLLRHNHPTHLLILHSAKRCKLSIIWDAQKTSI
jgi:hypothetical protein